MNKNVSFVKIGNSNVAILNKGKIRVFTNSSVSKFISSLKKADEVWLISVVPKLTRTLKKSLGLKVREVRGEDFLFKAKYKNVGTDRILNIFAAHQLRFSNYCVIDFGTAVTVDFVKSKVHLGGWILAGPSLWQRSLSSETSQLPSVAPQLLRRSKAFGRNTNESIQLGYMVLVRAIIDEAKRLASQKFKGDYKIIITGGWASLVHQGGVIEDHLGLKSLPALREQILRQQYDQTKI